MPRNQILSGSLVCSKIVPAVSEVCRRLLLPVKNRRYMPLSWLRLLETLIAIPSHFSIDCPVSDRRYGRRTRVRSLGKPFKPVREA